MIEKSRKNRCLLFDWGDTLMRVYPDRMGQMYTWPHVDTLPHVEEVLTRLHQDWLLALATNAAESNEQEIRMALERAHLNLLMDKVYCYRAIGHKKPSPEFFQHILQDLKLNRDSVFMIGDDFKADIKGANKCGIPAIWLNERSNKVRTGEKHRTIHDFIELPGMLDAMERNKNVIFNDPK